ncbi:MAG: M42 family metallopeptidase [Ruminococcaceae bacterium]|nr:M42 family metallopeptidase [Oscillospiraceae bacterium]
MKYYGLELIEQLCAEFGPSGCCDPVREAITEQIVDVVDAYCVDRVGNIVAKLCGGGEGYDAKNPKKVMICTGMDEVGLIIRRVADKGHLNFAPIGDIDPRVLGGKSLLVGDGTRAIKGIVASKAIHLQSAEERRRLTPVRKMYIDIGAEDAEEAKKYVDVGHVAVFDCAFERFGEEKAFMSAKALESRLGCAALIELLRMLKSGRVKLPYDLYVAFTDCSQIMFSAARVAAAAVKPDLCVIVEAREALDYPGISESTRMCALGQGAAVAFVDSSAVYDKDYTADLRACAAAQGIALQAVCGSPRAQLGGAVQQGAQGVRMVSLGYPIRNLHAPVQVAKVSDYYAVRDLLFSYVKEIKE